MIKIGPAGAEVHGSPNASRNPADWLRLLPLRLASKLH